LPARCNLPTHGECACSAHANDRIRLRDGCDKTAMRPFRFAKLLWTLVVIVISTIIAIIVYILRSRVIEKLKE